MARGNTLAFVRVHRSTLSALLPVLCMLAPGLALGPVALPPWTCGVFA